MKIKYYSFKLFYIMQYPYYRLMFLNHGVSYTKITRRTLKGSLLLIVIKINNFVNVKCVYLHSIMFIFI